MIVIKELVAKLSADNSEFKNGISEATIFAEQKTNGLLSTFNTVGTGLAVGLGGGLVAAFGAGTLAATKIATEIDTASDTISASLVEAANSGTDFESVMKDIYRNNFGENFDDIAESIVGVEQNFQRIGGIGESELSRVTQGALALRDIFGEGVNETTNAAVTLMENFGLTADEAMNMLASGYQKGLNSSDDFLDTIGEYSTQFASGGADVESFFSILETGMQGGMLGTDRAADAFKEFRVRIQDGSKLTAESLESIGINSELMLSKLASGEMTAKESFDQVLLAMNDVDDKTLLMQAGVGLLGTQFEDLGTESALALSTMSDSFANTEGAIDSLNVKYENWPSMLEGLRRSFILSLEPIGTKLLELGNYVFPYVESIVSTFAVNLETWLGTVTGLVDTFFSSWSEGASLSENILGGLTNLIGEEKVAQITALKDSVLGLFNGIKEAISTGIDIGSTVLGWLDERGISLSETIGAVALAFAGFQVLSTVSTTLSTLKTAFMGLQTAFASVGPITSLIALLGGPLTLTIGAIALAIGGLYLAWQNDWGGIQGKLTTVWSMIQPVLENLRTWLATNIPVAIQTVSDFFNNTLLPTLTTIRDFTNNHLVPLIKELARVFENVLKLAIDVVAGVFENFLLPAMKKVSDFVATSIMPKVRELADTFSEKLNPVLNKARDFFNNLKDAIGGLSGLVDGVTNAIKNFADWLGRIEIPEWLQRHSPPPLYTSLIEIAGAMKDVNEESKALGKNLKFDEATVKFATDGYSLRNENSRFNRPTELPINIYPSNEIDIELMAQRVARIIARKR